MMSKEMSGMCGAESGLRAGERAFITYKSEYMQNRVIDQRF